MKSLDFLRTEALLSLSKGEGPGHPFRGNQFVEGESGGGRKKMNFEGDTPTPSETSKKIVYFGSEEDVTGEVLISNPKKRPRVGSKVVVRVYTGGSQANTKLYGGTILSVDEDRQTVEFETEATGGRGFYSDEVPWDEIIGKIGKIYRVHNDVEDLDPEERADWERDNPS